jgi:hypothetical protein
MRLVFKDINGKPIKFGKSPECGGATPTPNARPTATPVPPPGTTTATPTPQASCIQLEEGYNASIRIANDVEFSDGETKTFCYYMNSGNDQLEFALRERNLTYCSRADITVYPPEGSTEVQPESRHWTNYATIILFVNGDAVMPRGTYRIQVTNKETPGCDDKYTIWGRIPAR